MPHNRQWMVIAPIHDGLTREDWATLQRALDANGFLYGAYTLDWAQHSREGLVDRHGDTHVANSTHVAIRYNGWTTVRESPLHFDHEVSFHELIQTLPLWAFKIERP
jgi:hypothetical protein